MIDYNDDADDETHRIKIMMNDEHDDLKQSLVAHPMPPVLPGWCRDACCSVVPPWDGRTSCCCFPVVMNKD